MKTSSFAGIDAFNHSVPVGTPVLAFPGSRDGRALMTRTRSMAWLLPNGEPLVMVDGYAGGIALTHIEVLPNVSAPDPTAGEPGLEARFYVRKMNDPTGKHAECRYFVLDPQHDPIARQALAAYADAVATSHPALHRDLWAWLGEVTP